MSFLLRVKVLLSTMRFAVWIRFTRVINWNALLKRYLVGRQSPKRFLISIAILNRRYFSLTLNNLYSLFRNSSSNEINLCRASAPCLSITSHILANEIHTGQILKSDLVIVQKFEPIEISMKSHGLGDFLLGSLRVAEEAFRLGKIPYFDFSAHPLSNYFSQLFPNVDIRPTYLLGKGDLKELSRHQVIFTHQRPALETYQYEATRIVKEQIINPKVILEELFSDVVKTFSLSEQFSVVHIRTKDSKLPLQNNDLLELEAKLHSAFQMDLDFLRQSLILSNNQQLKLFLKKRGYKCDIANSYIHFDPQSNPDHYLSTCVDFLLCLRARRLVQISEYSWGSGFSQAAHLLANNDFHEIRI